MKQAFTMIELVFAIVVIGILASIAMTKLSESRDSAQATICTHEYREFVNSLMQEKLARPSSTGEGSFFAATLKDITNISTDSSAKNGIMEPGTNKAFGIVSYQCDNHMVAKTAIVIPLGKLYIFTYTPNNQDSPASALAKKSIAQSFGKSAGDIWFIHI